jgi:RNA polymerase sigma factor (sigma-70 family)
MNPLQMLFQHGTVGDLTDRRLLDLFASGGEGEAEAAFRCLVERHGPMVLRLCRDVLGDPHDAEDAYQAVFLVLARRAGEVRRLESAGGWLFGVARRVAGSARRGAARRRKHEARWAEMEAIRRLEAGTTPDAREELYEEIARLPEKYRDAVVLCHLEGRPHEQAARQLGCPVRTLQSRLLRARARLRERLSRRGTTGAAIFPTGLSPRTIATQGLESSPGSTTRAALRFAAGEATAGPVVSLAEGVLRAMIQTKLKAAGLIGSALAAAALAGGIGAALARQEGRAGAEQGPARRAARPASGVGDPPEAKTRTAAPAIVPLPRREELHRLLRAAADDAAALARAKPSPSSWTLTTIASAQAKAGDLEGGRATFANAAGEAGGKFGGTASPWGLWRVGHFQAESGFDEDARATLRGAFEVLPGAAEDVRKDFQTVETYAVVAQEQAERGFRDDARRTVGRLLGFVQDSKVGDAAAPKVAAALAAVGDFEAAFDWSERPGARGAALGEIAAAAAKCLDRPAAVRFVREAAARIEKGATAEQAYFALGDLAEAQAAIGDVEEARRSARAIGEGPSGVSYDMTDGQPYALLRVADVQRRAGDVVGARQTLGDGFRRVFDSPKMRIRDDRYEQIALGQLAAGDLEAAFRTVEAMKVDRSETLALVALAQSAAGRPAAGATFALALKEAGVPDGPARTTQAASAKARLAKIRATAGDVAGALEALRSIEETPYRCSALSGVASARARAGDPAGAMKLALAEARTPEERRAALEGIAGGVDARLSRRWLDPRAE